MSIDAQDVKDAVFLVDKLLDLAHDLMPHEQVQDRLTEAGIRRAKAAKRIADDEAFGRIEEPGEG